MKIINWYSTLFLLVALAFTGCKKMDSTYKEFIVPGGITYTGKASKPMAFAGKNRIKIAWLRGADPNIVKAKIFWDNYTDSLDVNIPATGDTISVVINDLPEKSYSFMIKTYDDKGIASIPVELLSGSYGDRYQSQLLNRPVNALNIDVEGKITIKWGSADISNGAVQSELKYTDRSGNMKTTLFSATEEKSSLTDLMPGTRFQYRTVFRPDSMSIDNFYTAYVESGILTFDKASWSIIDFSTEHDNGSNAVKNFIDGTDGTRWHSRAGGSQYPHFATIDMGAERTITQFGVWRTTFENGGDARAPNKIQFLVSTDNINWVDLGLFNFNRLLNGEQTFVIPSKPRARYVKFVAVEGPENNLVIGEISAYGL
ncbi:MAG: DUF4998 domain-containing protein [Sphingobacteriaceae bacterium]